MAPPSSNPETMKAWQYTKIHTTLEEALVFSTNAAGPPSRLPLDSLLVEVISVSLNPVDYKLPESWAGALMGIKKPASPGTDFSGRIVSGSSTSQPSFTPGKLVFGSFRRPPQFGSLGQFIVVSAGECALIPEGVSPDDAAALGCAAVTAFQSLPSSIVKPGSKVFINGGSGGVGSFAIQIAKAMGAHVTTTCSTSNIALCQSLGADEVLDYKTCEISAVLNAKGPVFDLAVDNVGALPYRSSGAYLKPNGTFELIGMELALSTFGAILRDLFLPTFLGGGNRAYSKITVSSNTGDLEKIGELVATKKVKVLVDEKFKWEDTPKAYAKLRADRTKGKIIVQVGPQ